MQTSHPDRLIVLDTETTGLNPQDGHRIIEIGCVELINRRLTGQHFHVYLNPDKMIEAGASAVHGITNDFLKDKPRFADIVEEFLAFIEGSQLIIHNAPFDVGFIDHELQQLDAATQKLSDYCTIFDTLVEARKRFVGQRNSLDALCKRFGIDNSHRELHGALLDAEILADVFLQMTGGQFSLMQDENISSSITHESNVLVKKFGERPSLVVLHCDEDVLKAHEARLDSIEKASGQCIWRNH
jgi:DNA polymerase-3 subunit epsilon